MVGCRKNGGECHRRLHRWNIEIKFLLRNTIHLMNRLGDSPEMMNGSGGDSREMMNDNGGDSPEMMKIHGGCWPELMKMPGR